MSKSEFRSPNPDESCTVSLNPKSRHSLHAQASEGMISEERYNRRVEEEAWLLRFRAGVGAFESVVVLVVVSTTSSA